MKNREEEDLEKFIRDNKEKFDVYQPEPYHSQHFLNKLINKFRAVISIVPHLIKVGIGTILVFVLSFLLWKAWLCPPLSRVSFKYWKVEHDYKRQINRSIRQANSSIINPDEKAEFESELQAFDLTYEILKKQLRKDPSNDNIANMLRFYNEKLLTIQGNAQKDRNDN